ncbi:enoyl-CoA hydratase-related protein [Celeribacter sp.]|uniref:enoyl-CoA hydratase-related protein n=1 Tax=Celeribacter sp. TaxID=1890673 RepID=UPI003A9372B7
MTRKTDGDVAVLTLSRPFRNTLNAAMRAALLEAVTDCAGDAAISAIVIASAGRGFSVGRAEAEITAREGDAEPTLTTLCTAIADSPKPVVVTLKDAVFEAGLAVALAADVRVAGPTARMWCPDVSYGLVPDAGVIVRALSLGGIEAARELVIKAAPLDAKTAHGLGLIDHIASEVPVRLAVEKAKELGAKGSGGKAAQEIALTDMAGAVRSAAALVKEMEGQRLNAPRRAAAVIEAALLLPFAAAVSGGDVARDDLRATAQTRALLHMHFTSRKATRPRGFTVTKSDAVKTVGISGTGNMALGLAIAALDHGLEVRLRAPDGDVAQADLARLHEVYAKGVAAGRLDAAGAEARLNRLQIGAAREVLSSAQVVFEATTGSLAARIEALVAAEADLPAEVPLATVADRGYEEMLARVSHPERLCVAHAFAPAQISPLVELARFPETNDRTMARFHSALNAMGKRVVTLAARDGLVANTVQMATFEAVDVLLLMGARPHEIDAAMQACGRAKGPCATMDALGLARFRGAVAAQLAAEGLTFFDGRGRDEEACDEIDYLRRAHGLEATNVSRAEIIGRICLAEANAGARLWEEGVVAHPVEIDTIMVGAAGYPREEGGPMQWADAFTPLQAEKALRHYEKAAPDIWAPAAIWHELIRDGKTFSDFN